MQEEPALRVSFLTTMEDYVQERLDLLSLGVTKTERRITKIVGGLLIVLGISGALFFQNHGSDWIFWTLSVLSGLCVLFYYDKIFSFLNAVQARKDYLGLKERLLAQTFCLTKEQLEITSVRQDCRYPWEYLYRCVMTKNLVIFYLGIGSTRVLPLRLVPEEKRQALRDFLKNQMGSRFEEKNDVN